MSKRWRVAVKWSGEVEGVDAVEARQRARAWLPDEACGWKAFQDIADAWKVAYLLAADMTESACDDWLRAPGLEEETAEAAMARVRT